MRLQDPKLSFKYLPRTNSNQTTQTAPPGQLFVSYTQQADPQDLANDYSLVVISEMASLRKFTVQISDFGGFTALEQQLRTDPRVLSTELDVSFAPLRPE